jgi:hypothetical protein
MESFFVMMHGGMYAAKPFSPQPHEVPHTVADFLMTDGRWKNFIEDELRARIEVGINDGLADANVMSYRYEVIYEKDFVPTKQHLEIRINESNGAPHRRVMERLVRFVFNEYGDNTNIFSIKLLGTQAMANPFGGDSI